MQTNRSTGNANPSILRITDEKTLQLVQECEKQECLWNTHLVDYPNKEERQWAYEVIAERLNIPYFTPRHVMTKFKNLRNSYCQELKKMAADENYKPKVMWFSYMDKYLRPHLQRIQTNAEKTQENTNDETKTHVDSDEQVESRDSTFEHSTQSDTSRSKLYRNKGAVRMIAEEKEFKKFIKKRRRSEESNDDKSEIKKSYLEIDDSSTEYHEEVDPLTGVSSKILEIEEMPSTASRHAPPRGPDHFESFGTYIASLLRALPPKKALMLQPEIVKMIVSVGVEGLSDSQFSFH